MKTEALDVEDQIRVGGNIAYTLVPIGQLGWDGDATLSANGKTEDTNVHALDDLTRSDLESEWLSLLVGYDCISMGAHIAKVALTVKLLAVLQLANVAQLNLVALLGTRTLSDLLVVNDDSIDSPRTRGSLGGVLLVIDFGRTSWAQFQILGELNLLVLLFAVGSLLLVLLGSGLLRGGCGFAVILLQLLGLLLAQLGLSIHGFLSLGSLVDQVIQGSALLFIFGRALVLGLFIAFDELRSLVLRGELNESGIRQVVKLIFFIRVLKNLILIWRKVVVFLLRIIVLGIMVMIMLFRREDIVTSKVNVMGTGGGEVNSLALADNNVESLLIVLHGVSGRRWIV